MALTLISLGVLFSMLAIPPFCSYPISLLLLRRFRRQPALKAIPEFDISVTSKETFCVCVCAYNEERGSSR